ncbi:MAG: porin [Pseudomonadota bacterium]
MHKQLTRMLAMAGMIAVPVLGHAETPVTMPEKPATPTIGQIMGAAGIEIGGYLDVSYTHLSSSGKFSGGSLNNRVFDIERNSFNLQAVNLSVSKLPTEGFGGMVDLIAGKDADTIAAYGTIDSTKGPANGANHQFDVTQAYLHYATGPWMVIAGKYVTLSGAEVIKSPSNTNFSRSILFGYAIPFTHSGVRGYYKLNDAVSFIAGVNNGWDNLKDTNSQKTLELGASFAPTKNFSLSAQGYSGTEQIANYPTISSVQGTRNLVDLVATFTATDQLSFVLNYDYGSQQNASLAKGGSGTAKWEGLAGYVNYQFNDQWRMSLRGEYFNDKDGYRTVVESGKSAGQKWKEATLTLAYLPNKNVELRAEIRGDKSDQKTFLQTNGSLKDNQNSFGLEAIYKF